MANPQINSSQAIVDDRDPRIVFTGDWSLAGVSQEYNTSEHGTRSKGAMAQFSFNGEPFWNTYLRASEFNSFRFKGQA
jgi:hypothetical protein